MLTYINKRGKEVTLQVTRHAYKKFIERYSIIFPKDVLSVNNISNTFKRVFSSTSKVKNLNQKEKIRLKRHGEDTMFFRTSGFTFVIANAKIVTVEISDKNKRYLNKIVA